MGQIHQEVLVEAPIEHVYELAMDIGRQPDWNPYMEVTNVSGPLSTVGTTFDSTFHLLGQTVKSKGTVVESEPQRLLRLQGEGESGTSDFIYRFEPIGETTRCTLDVEYEISGAMAPILDRLVYHGALERATRHMAENFKALAEAKVAQPA
jgi:uncharacterized membrane protein